MSTTKAQHSKKVCAFRRGSGIALESGSIDEAAGVITGISIMTAGVEALGHGIFDANGDYREVFSDARTLETALECVEAIGEPLKAYMNHIDDVEGIVGAFDNFRIDGDHLRADFHVAEGIEEGLRARIFWMAEKISKQFGISVVGMCEFDEIDDAYLLRFIEVSSADFVGAPALNAGLFSKKPQTHKKNMSEDLKKQIEALTKRFTAVEKENASLKKRLSLSEKKLAEIEVTIDTETDEVTVDADDENVEVTDETEGGEVTDESLEDETEDEELEEGDDEKEKLNSDEKKLSRIIDRRIDRKFSAFAKAIGVKRGVKLSSQPTTGKGGGGNTYAAAMSARIASGKRFHVALSEVEREHPDLVKAECKRLGVPSSAYLVK